MTAAEPPQERPTGAPAARPALFRGKLWFWAPIAPLLALDLWSKSAVFAFMAETYGGQSVVTAQHPVWSADAPIRFHLVSWHNPGTIWGLFQDQTTPLVVLRCVALVLILYFARLLATGAKFTQLVLGLVMAGALGNLYDNLTEARSGVRDFLLFSAEFNGELYKFPAFNVADSCICVGAISLAIMLWRGSDGVVSTSPENRRAT